MNLLNSSNGFDCTHDVPLQFGDVVEIPEREHTLAEPATAFSNAQMADLRSCLSRKVTFVVRGHATEVTLGGFAPDSYLSQAMRVPAVQAILLSSSDLTKVLVKHKDKGTESRLVDVARFWNQGLPLRDDAWLRDGDVVEVSDR